MASVKENLIAARALIDTPERWQREDYDNVNGCMCAVGAIGVAIYSRDWWKAENSPEGLALTSALPAGDWADSITRFNDHPDTTHPDILALFDRAIAAAEVAE